MCAEYLEKSLTGLNNILCYVRTLAKDQSIKFWDWFGSGPGARMDVAAIAPNARIDWQIDSRQIIVIIHRRRRYIKTKYYTKRTK